MNNVIRLRVHLCDRIHGQMFITINLVELQSAEIFVIVACE